MAKKNIIENDESFDLSMKKEKPKMDNLISSLKEIEDDIKCSFCKNLTSLIGLPDQVNGDLHLDQCYKLTLNSLDQLPSRISKKLYLNSSLEKDSKAIKRKTKVKRIEFWKEY